jgi:hypothetical protein
MNQMRKYEDGLKTDHRMTGTVIPKATNRSDIVGGHVDQNSVGADFDMQNPAPQVLVESNEKGEFTSHTPLDKPAIDRLIAANRAKPGQAGHRPISYEEAIKEKGAGVGAVANSVPPFAQHPVLEQLEKFSAEPIVIPKTKVRFSGAFGKINFSYQQVFVHEIFLVLVQHTEDGDFYEPPGESGQAMAVDCGPDRNYSCYPCAHIPFPDGRTAVTILMIDEQLLG